MKRNRNQRRRQGGGGGGGGMNINRALDSNGPDVRIRGTANQIYEKYQALARDAASSGDRVKAENYLQHAEHYYRLIRAMQPAQPPPGAEPPAEGDFEGEQPSIGEFGERRPSYGDGPAERAERPAEAESDQAPRDDDGEPRPTQEHRSEPRFEPRGDHGQEGASRDEREPRDAGRDGDDRRNNRRRHRPRRPDRDDRRFSGGEERDGAPAAEPTDADEVPA
ncbi:MAG: DUF4167 domain-containing protein [Parvularculaceae bacterium]|nr:DUF4167 domain-containing protein [Parvularculaceae bacterium]